MRRHTKNRDTKKELRLTVFLQRTEELLLQYLDDMEIGANVSPVIKRGPRSYIRLRNLKSKIHSWAIIIQDELDIDYIPEAEQKEREFLQLIKKLRDGQIQTRKQIGEVFTGVGTLIKSFKSMWHWYQRVQRKEGITVRDISQDIDGRDEKPHFNYFTIEQLNEMCNKAKYEYRVLMMFLFDTGIRAPTEMMNVKVSDDGKTYNCSKNGLTMYDFRHSSACYWLPRYKSESALKYRFGWKKSEMIHYYTELLGMRDTIEEEDLYVDVSKTQLERDIANKGNEITLLQEQIQAQERKMEQMMDVMKALQLETKYKEMEPYTVIIEKRT